MDVRLREPRAMSGWISTFLKSIRSHYFPQKRGTYDMLNPALEKLQLIINSERSAPISYEGLLTGTGF